MSLLQTSDIANAIAFSNNWIFEKCWKIVHCDQILYLKKNLERIFSLIIWFDQVFANGNHLQRSVLENFKCKLLFGLMSQTCTEIFNRCHFHGL